MLFRSHFVWDPAFVTAFPALCRWIEALPFTVLHGFDLVTQTADVRPHLDVFGLNNSQTMFARNRALEPVFYRILFTGPDDDACRSRSFFVSREVDDPPTYVELPDGASVIALTSSVAYHGATDRPGRKTTGVLYGVLDEQAHLELLARSLARRPDLAVRFPPSGPVEGPGAVLPYGGAE